jgi:nucleotide-binding universal stress UspA family protein
MKPLVVAAIDGSAAAQPVLQWAQAFAQLIGGSVQALHVTEDGDERAAAFAAADEIPLQTLTGDVITSLSRAVANKDVVAIVLGARGRPGGPRPAGHVALELITRVNKPVILVPPDVADPGRLRRVLFAVEGQPEGTPMPGVVFELLAKAGIHMGAVHVDSESSLPAYSDQVQHETEVFADEFIARNVPASIDIDLALRVGQPGSELLAACDESTADLIVVVWSCDLSPGRAHVVRELLERSRIPILLVPAVKDEPAPPAKHSVRVT